LSSSGVAPTADSIEINSNGDSLIIIIIVWTISSIQLLSNRITLGWTILVMSEMFIEEHTAGGGSQRRDDHHSFPAGITSSPNTIIIISSNPHRLDLNFEMRHRTCSLFEEVRLTCHALIQIARESARCRD